MNVQLILIHTALLTFLFPAGITEKPSADTLKIKTAGTGNHIRVDSARFFGSSTDTAITARVTGEIDQVGENNRVEIKTGREIPNNKRQITNNNQKPNSKNQTNNKQRVTSNLQPATSHPLKQSGNPDSSGQRVTIKQTGKNNSVKINQR